MELEGRRNKLGMSRVPPATSDPSGSTAHPLNFPQSGDQFRGRPKFLFPPEKPSIADLKVKGLCFKCKEKYGLGHRGKAKLLQTLKCYDDDLEEEYCEGDVEDILTKVLEVVEDILTKVLDEPMELDSM
ncbi:hypothetical protein Dimus_024846 [Dionaea muscipula]